MHSCFNNIIIYDNGHITLVYATKNKNGDLKESDKFKGIWAWKTPTSDGSYNYTELKGNVKFENVDFGYNKNEKVLKDISIYAKPGQKIAFVGSTGAGKTTITNLV
jgi:ATP-binding cassette subfamily B protein